MEQGLIDLRDKAKEYGNKHEMISQFPISCENMIALVDRIETLENILMQTAVAHHTHRHHNQPFEECGYLVCKQARLVIGQ